MPRLVTDRLDANNLTTRQELCFKREGDKEVRNPSTALIKTPLLGSLGAHRTGGSNSSRIAILYVCLLVFVTLAISAGAQTTTTNEWTWIAGSSMIPACSPGVNCGQPGVYGTLGTPAAGNVPGGRYGASSWTDSRGNHWLFGGYGFDANGAFGYLTDLWEFSPSTNKWTWMSGSSTVPNSSACGSTVYCSQPAVYGTLGSPAAGNIPGGRGNAVTWTDSSGNLWLFGGSGFDANGNVGSLNDLWEFSPSSNEWAWLGGSSLLRDANEGQAGVYGTLGTPATGNIPGGRFGALSWTDSGGHFWLFGGQGDDASGNEGDLNDLWEFNPAANEWAWVSGRNQENQPGLFGTLGTAAPGNIPGGRYSGVSWIDSSGNLWLFGGLGEDAHGSAGLLNDLWEFNPSISEWAWMGGSNSVGISGAGQPGVYGTLGTSATGNVPGGRYGASNWADSSSPFWLLGGMGMDAKGNSGNLDDLWEFDPSNKEWTWMGGSSTVPDSYGGQAPVYSGLGSAGGNPGSLFDASTWTDGSRHFWLFGGYGYDQAAFNDLWEYQPLIAATPVFSPFGGHFSSAQTVSVSDASVGATIYYTVNGTAPTTTSTPFTAPITVSNGETLEAVAIAPGYSLSKAAVATFVLPTAPPVISPAGGSYSAPQTVTLEDATPGAAIYYTLNGTNPTSASTLYTGPIAVSAPETVKAMAIAPGDSQSSLAIAYYAFLAAAPMISPGSGTYPPAQAATITDSTPGAVIYYTTSGMAPVPKAANTYVYSAPIKVSTTETIEALAVAPGYSNSPLATANYLIASTAAAPVATPVAGTYPAGQLVTLSDSTTGATIYYTTNGSTPTTSSQTYTAPFLVGATQTVQAIAVENGFLNSPVSTAPYTVIGSPSALALPATAVSTPNATLNANVNSNGLTGTYLFQYGTSAVALTSSTASTPLTALGLPVLASAGLTGLASATTYYYQVVVTTEGGTATGTVLSFTTN